MVAPRNDTALHDPVPHAFSELSLQQLGWEEDLSPNRGRYQNLYCCSPAALAVLAVDDSQLTKGVALDSRHCVQVIRSLDERCGSSLTEEVGNCDSLTSGRVP